MYDMQERRGRTRRADWLSIWVACSLRMGAAHVIPRLASHLINCPRHPTKSDLLYYLGTVSGPPTSDRAAGRQGRWPGYLLGDSSGVRPASPKGLST